MSGSTIISLQVQSAGSGTVVEVLWDCQVRADLSPVLAQYFLKSLTQEGKTCRKSIPMIVTPHIRHRRSFGLHIPSEFVIGVMEMDSILSHVRHLQTMYPGGVDQDVMRPMLTGVFRKALCLDDDNHGQGEMDPRDLAGFEAETMGQWKNKDKVPWPKVVVERIEAINRGNEDLQRVFRALFSNEMGQIKALMLQVKSRRKPRPKEGTS